MRIVDLYIYVLWDCVCVCVSGVFCVFKGIYLFVYIGQERERERDKETGASIL